MSQESTSDFLGALAGLTGATTGGELGPRVAGAVHADDPLAADNIVAWYEGLGPLPASPSPLPAPELRPPEDETLAIASRGGTSLGNDTAIAPTFPEDYLRAVEVIREGVSGRGLDPAMIERMLAPYTQGLLTSTLGNLDSGGLVDLDAIGGCSLDEVKTNVDQYLEFLDGAYGANAAISNAPVFWEGARESLRFQQTLAIGVGQPSLAAAIDYDRLMGGVYWTSRWLQQAQWSYLSLALGGDAILLYEAQDQAGDRASRASARTISDYAAAYAGLVDEHQVLVEQSRRLIDGLRAAGCEGLADYAHLVTARVLSWGSERLEQDARGEEFWNGYRPLGGLGKPQWLRYVENGLGGLGSDIDAVVDQVLGPSPVTELLGPVPYPPPYEPFAEGGPVADPSSGVPPSLGGGLGGVRPDRRGAETANTPSVAGDWSDEAWRNGDQPFVGRPTPANQPSPLASGQAAASTTGTWLSIAGLGHWPQTTLAGYWRSPDLDEGGVSLIVPSPDGQHFDGFVFRGGARGGRWIDMDRDGEAAWEGSIYVSLRSPKGACPRWTQGVFLGALAVTRLRGAWAGQKVVADGCLATEEPDGGPVTLERIVATSFTPIVPGKFIHLLGAPAGGSTAAQYRAAVEFACATAELGAVTPRVSASAGSVVELGTCSYQLVVDRPGSYDLTIEFVDASGEVAHADHLRADVPPIPGLAA